MASLKACPRCGGEIVLRVGKGPECNVCGTAVIDPEAKPLWVLGLDLGQTTDYTALCALEQSRKPDPTRPGRTVTHYACRHLERYRLGTSYPDMIKEIAKRTQTDALRGSTMAVDQTGVGRPVVDLLRLAALPVTLRPITITAGHSVTEDREDLSFHVPKKDLVSVLQILLQGERLAISPELKLAETLKKELTNFKVKITPAANEVFGAWREGDKDDLVLSVALAAWVAERAHLGPPEIGMPREHKGGLVDRLPRGVFGRRPAGGW